MGSKPTRRSGDRDADRAAERRLRYQRVLRAVDLWDFFAPMDRVYQDQFYRGKFPEPTLVFDPSFPNDEAHRDIRKGVEAAFKRATIPASRSDVLVTDFYSVLLGVHSLIRASLAKHDLLNAPKAPESLREWLRAAIGLLSEDEVEQMLHATYDAWHTVVLWPQVERSRLDGRLYTTRFEHGHGENGKLAVSLVLGTTNAEERQVSIDGGPRRAYRVGTMNEWSGPLWRSWPKEGGAAAGEVPIFVQGHALHRLRQRVNLPKFSESLEYWLDASLKEPTVVERSGADLVVAYRIQDHRIGYLIVRPLPDMMLVRTFKFLTMSGTPESRAIERQLKLTRREMDWLGLDDLAAFTQSDLRHDDQLAELFERCGCGHLFDLADDRFTATPKPLAGEVRKFLRLAA